MVEIKVYTTNYCPFCIKAKYLLRELEIEFEEIELKGHEDFDELVEKTGYHTVPQIFINDKLIGGFEELYNLHKSGELSEKIE